MAPDRMSEAIGFLSTLRVTDEIGAEGEEELELIDFRIKILLNFLSPANQYAQRHKLAPTV
jgi:hypothetical protein